MKFIIASIVVFLLGLFMVLFPYKYWKIFKSWKTMRGAEPTNRYLIGVRIGGCICMIASVIVLFLHIS